MVVLCPTSDGGYAELADDVATQRGESVVSDVEVGADGPVLYVTPPEEIDEELVLELQRRLVEKGPERGAFSVITGSSPERARQLYEREAPGEGEHCVALREETRDWFTYDDDAEVLTGNDVTVDSVGEAENLASLSMLVHGRSMHFFFADGYLCGFPGDPGDADFEGPQPYCVVDGERECPLEGDLLPADQLAVPHLFVDSCASMLPENDFEGLPVHVGMGLLGGAVSLVGGYRQIDSIPQLSLLHYCLLRAGYSTVERCYYLNRVAHAYDTAAYPYVPFGRPDVTFPPDGDQQFEATFDPGGRLDLEAVDAHVVELQVPKPESTTDEWFLRNRIEEFADAPLYYAAFEEGAELTILLYTWGRLEAERLSFAVDDRPVEGRDRAAILDALENAERISRLGLLDDKANGQLKDVRNRLNGFASDADPQSFDVNAHWEVGERTGRVLDAVDRVTDRVVSKLDDRYSSFLSDDYREDFLETEVRTSDQRCPTCDRPLFHKRMTDWTHHTRRLRGICSLCGVIFDVPDGEDPAFPQISGDLVRVTDDVVPFEVSFRNALDVPMRTTIHPWLGTDDDRLRGADVFEPDAVDAILEPGERRTVDFELDATDLEPNEYWVISYVVANLGVYQGLAKLIVGDSVGHLRADLRSDRTPLD